MDLAKNQFDRKFIPPVIRERVTRLNFHAGSFKSAVINDRFLTVITMRSSQPALARISRPPLASGLVIRLLDSVKCRERNLSVLRWGWKNSQVAGNGSFTEASKPVRRPRGIIFLAAHGRIVWRACATTKYSTVHGARCTREYLFIYSHRVLFPDTVVNITVQVLVLGTLV